MDNITTTVQAPDRPDAVKIPIGWVASSENPLVQGLSVTRKCSTLLQCDADKDEKAICRNQETFWFATRGLYNTLFFPSNHFRATQSRYKWKKQPDGSTFGYLVEGATEGGEPDAAE